MYEKLVNWIGQIRLYSLVDLVLLLLVSGANPRMLAGATLLHVAFLLFLERLHADRGRLAFPQWALPVTLLWGAWLYGTEAPLHALGYCGASVLYTLKKQPQLGWCSPLARGVQTVVLIGGVCGVTSGFAIVAGLLMVVRNAVGDMRDITKDRAEGVRTIPVLLGMQQDWKVVHQLAVHGTTLVWWLQGDLPISWLLAAFSIQLATYHLTPR